MKITSKIGTIGLLAGIGLLVAATGPARSDTMGAAAADQQSLGKVAAAVGDFKALRLKSAQLDAIVAPYCKKTDGAKDEDSITAEYTCKPESGISKVSMDSRGENTAGKSYMMYIVVDAPLDRYAPLREQLVKKLGRPNKTDKDSAYWVNRSDKELNKYGTPAITLSRDTESKTASLQLGLEQGP